MRDSDCERDVHQPPTYSGEEEEPIIEFSRIHSREISFKAAKKREHAGKETSITLF